MLTNVCTKLLEKFTGNVRTLRRPADHSNEEEGVTPLLTNDHDLDDFVRNDPQDTIFEEYDSPFPSETPFDWKSHRPSLLKSVVDSAWVVLQLIVLGGIILALFGVICFYIDINTADLCHWVPLQVLGRLRKRIRVAGVAFQGFLIEFWQFLILWTMFKWPPVEGTKSADYNPARCFCGRFLSSVSLHIRRLQGTIGSLSPELSVCFIAIVQQLRSWKKVFPRKQVRSSETCLQTLCPISLCHAYNLLFHLLRLLVVCTNSTRF